MKKKEKSKVGKKLFFSGASLILMMLIVTMLFLTGCSVPSEQKSGHDKNSNKEKQTSSTNINPGEVNVKGLSYTIQDCNSDYYYKVGNKWNWDGAFTRYLAASYTGQCPVMEPAVGIRDYNTGLTDWQIVWVGNGYYMFLNRITGLILGDDSSSPQTSGKDGFKYCEARSFDSKYMIDNKTGSKSVLWTIIASGDGYWYIKNVGSGGYLNIEYQVYGGSSTICAITYPANGRSPETLGWWSAQWSFSYGNYGSGSDKPMSSPKEYYLTNWWFSPSRNGCAYVNSADNKVYRGAAPYNDYSKWIVVSLRSYWIPNLILIFNKADQGYKALEDKNGLYNEISDLGNSTLYSTYDSFSAYLWQITDSGFRSHLKNMYTNKYLSDPWRSDYLLQVWTNLHWPEECTYWVFNESVQ